MSLSPEDEMNAAEFALGTLDDGERSAIAARRQREDELESAIVAWEQRLAPLIESIPELAPPRDHLPALLARIDRSGRGIDDPARNVADLTRRLSRWRVGAITASGLAAALALGIGLRETTRSQMPHEFVAVLQKSADAPAFLVTVNLDTRDLIVRPVAAPAQTGKSYELWIINDKLGAPRSLGVIDQAHTSANPKLAAYDRAVVADATYAVTVEPEGGSPTGVPTSAPVFVGKLIPTGQ
jgi:anti-sigma-K factor RskA